MSEESIPTLCWTMTIDESVHDYELAFGYLDHERTAVIFASVLGPDGVQASHFPESVLVEALIVGGDSDV